MWLLDKMLSKLIKKGELIVTNHDGKEYRYGAPDPNHGPVRARLTDRGAAWHIAKDPRVGAGEAYMDKRLVIEPPSDIRDLVLLIGGLFLIAKSTHEIHGSLEGEEGHASKKTYSSFASVIVQITLLDIVFSLDSVITAVGMVNNLAIMISAVVVSIIAMMLFAGSIGAFVQRHPTIKMLALSFLLLIGVTLVGEGSGQHIPKGYIYFAMAFSVFVEMLNIRLRKKAKPVELHNAFSEEDEARAMAD